MSEFVDLPRLFEAARIVGVIVIAIITILFMLWFSKWVTSEDAPWWKIILGITLIICSLIFMLYNFLGSVP